MPDDRVPTIEALLCERCGYELEGLDLDTDCPECALAIRTSLPRRRPGSPYQNRRKTTSLLKTFFLILFRPKRTIRNLDIDRGSGVAMMWHGLFVSTALFSLAYLVFTSTMFIMMSPGSFALGMLVAPVFTICAIGLVLWLLGVGYAALGYARVRWLANQRGSRMPVATAWTITGHASMGLTLAPLMMGAGLLVQMPFTLIFLFNDSPSDGSLAVAGVLSMISGFLFILAIPIALVEFEVLLSMCTRRLRYRNLVTPEPVGHAHAALVREPADAGHRMDIS